MHLYDFNRNLLENRILSRSVWTQEQKRIRAANEWATFYDVYECAHSTPDPVKGKNPHRPTFVDEPLAALLDDPGSSALDSAPMLHLLVLNLFLSLQTAHLVYMLTSRTNILVSPS